MPGTSFDRVAHLYDESRGGDRRGGHFAAAVSPWIVGPRVLEAGVGTGAVARGLSAAGHGIVGVDLSEAMLRHAVERVGPTVAIADVDRLPVADDALDTVVFVWVLQLVDDPETTLAEAARVVRPGGRVMTVLSFADDDPDDEMAQILAGLRDVRRRGRGLDPVLSSAPDDLELIHAGSTSWQEFSSSPADQIRLIETRSFSSLFELDDETWSRVVEPVLDDLRALPEPERTRTRRNRHPLVVWEVAAHR
jgi:SAM-dependent methyltransferase